MIIDQEPQMKIDPVKQELPEGVELKELKLTDAYGADFHDEDNLGWKDRILLYAVVICVVSFVGWASFADIDEVTRGQGQVIPSTHVKNIQNLEGGIVDQILVKDGELVEAGQLLLKIRGVQAQSDYQSNRLKYLALKASQARLKAIAEGAELSFDENLTAEIPESVASETAAYYQTIDQFNQEEAVLTQQLKQRQQQVAELNTRIKGLKDIIAISQKELDMVRKLAEKGYAAQRDLLQQERQMTEQKSQLNTYNLTLPRLRASVAEVESQLAEHKSGMKAKAREQLPQIISEMAAIKETLTALEDRQERTEVKSPVKGHVKDIKITTIGGVVQPGEVMMEVVPMEDQLLVEANIKPSDIAFIHPEQPAVIKIDAYDFSVYGGLEGELVSISPDSIKTQEGDSFYRVRVRTAQSNLNRGGKEHKIIPGMTVSVDILTGEKTIMDYILKPLKKTLHTAMRER